MRRISNLQKFAIVRVVFSSPVSFSFSFFFFNFLFFIFLFYFTGNSFAFYRLYL